MLHEVSSYCQSVAISCHCIDACFFIASSKSVVTEFVMQPSEVELLTVTFIFAAFRQ